MALRSLVFTIVLACALPANALPDKFRDEEDGALDLGNYLLRHRGVLPVPVVITEPAVGYGMGLALAYFSQSFEERAEASRAAGEPIIPPDIAVGFGAKTENGTSAMGAGYLGFWDHDRWRYTGALGKAELQLDYFSVSGEARAYRLDGEAIVQQMLRRVGSSRWYAGGRYAYFSSRSRFAGERPDDVPQRELDSSIGRLGIVVDYDSRDNIFTPNCGLFLEVEASVARRAFGSDTDHEAGSARIFGFQPMGDFILGLRADARGSRGDVPFYAEPYVALRGVPAARYQDKNALAAEAELRWNITSRWAAVHFGGVGKAYGRRQSWDESKTVGAGGVGFRYLVARKLGMYAGLDVARSAEDSAIYITAGSAWR
jgi:hypothetical protein